MATNSTTKFIKNVAGTLREEHATTTSAGAADAHRVPALNDDGVLDPSIINSTEASAGAADAGKHPALDASGRLSQTFMPTGIGADTQNIVASEPISGGDLVNVWNSAGTAKIRRADATIAGKEAHGFVLVGGDADIGLDVYFEGSNTAVTGLVPGNQFLSTTAGTSGPAAPTGTGQVVQRVGFATSDVCINFQSGVPIVLA